jgi:hypothetical protein
VPHPHGVSGAIDPVVIGNFITSGDLVQGNHPALAPTVFTYVLGSHEWLMWRSGDRMRTTRPPAS